MDFSEKRALKKYLIFLLPFLIAPFIGVLVPWYKDMQRKSKESYIKAIGQAINIAEQSYHQEWKTYSPSLKDVGFSATVKDISIYTKIEEIPESDLKKLQPQDHPFFKADAYQMIIKWKNESNGEETLWVLDESGKVRKLSNFIP